MIRHIGLLLLLSFAMLFLMPPLQWLVGKLYQFELFFAREAGIIFSNGVVGHVARQIITLTLTPLVMAGIPALIYWLFTRRALPYFGHIIWGLWLMLVIILACNR